MESADASGLGNSGGAAPMPWKNSALVTMREFPEITHMHGEGRIISIYYCEGLPEIAAVDLKKQLEETIPGVNVLLSFNPNQRRFRVSEGQKKFYFAEGPWIPNLYIETYRRNKIVDSIVAYRYLPDDDDNDNAAH